MNSLLQLAAVLAMAAVSVANVVKSPDSVGNFELLILHNNDMHARFEQTSQLSGACTDADRDAGKCYGGFARVAHVVKEARKAAAEGRGPPVLYLNAGDTYTGTAWFTIYKWKIAAEFINALQPDAVCLGNHEFDSGVGGLIPFIKHVTCPVLAANLDLTNVPELAKQTNLRKSIIFNITGVEIGIIGYLTPETKTLAVKNDVEYMDEIIALKIEVNNLRKQGINIIIALGHSGYERDKVIAKEVDGIDLIIGGHSHSFLYNGSEPDSEASEGDYPTYVTQASGKQVPIVQAYAFTKYMGQLHLVFNSNGDLITLHGKPKLLDETVPEDPSMLELLNHYRGEVENIAHQVIGNTSVVLDGRTCDQQECNLGNLITDSMVYYYAIQHHGEYWTDAPIGILQAGGIRSSIAHDVLPAQVTKEDLLTVLPFKGSLVVVTMNGTVLKQMLEHSVARYEQGKMGEFLQVSGLKVLYDLNNITGHRVLEVKARCADCDIPKLQNIENSQLYKVIMPDFVANGGDGFEMLKYQGAKILPYNELAATQHYIAHNHYIFPSIEGRITFHKKSVETNSSNKLTALSAVSIIIYLLILYAQKVLWRI